MDPTIDRPDLTDRLLSALAHIAILFTGMGGLIIPVLIWSMRGKKSRYTAFQAQQALGYQIIQSIYSTLILLIFAILYLLILLKTLPATPPQSPVQIPIQPFIFPTIILTVLLGLYLIPALAATAACLLGVKFYYPFIGKRLEVYLVAHSADKSQIDGEDRWMAANCHLSQMTPFWGMLVPLLAWMLWKDSRPICFQSLQALLYQAFGLVVALFVGMGLLATILLPLVVINQAAASSLSPYSLLVPFYIAAGVTALLILLLPVYSTLPIIAAYRLLKGKEYRYPILGKWLQKRLRLDHGGI